MDTTPDMNQERSARAALRTIASMIEERKSDAACLSDISFLLQLCGVPVEYRSHRREE